MDITPVIAPTRQLIQKYGGGVFSIGGRPYASSVIVFPDVTLAWPVVSFEEVTETAFEPVFFRAPEVEILLLGCGKTQAFVPPPLRDSLKRRGIVLDCMDTGAACRTFNVLLAEERRVAAALVVV